MARFLMSPPSRFEVHHLLNPWMRWDEEVDGARAARQWDALVAAILDAGGEVEVMEPAGRSGAMTFTRDAALVVDDARAMVLRNHGIRGELEPRYVRRWLRRHGYVVERLPRRDRLDGGNLLEVPEGWLVGLPRGCGAEAARRLAARLGWKRVIGVPLASRRFGHLDTVLADLAGRAWLVHPGGLVDPQIDGADWRHVWAGRPVITVDETDALALACNVVVVGHAVIGGGLSTRLCREIERLCLDPVPLVLDEFAKAGGGAHCLTLGLSTRRSRGYTHDAPQDATGRRAARR